MAINKKDLDEISEITSKIVKMLGVKLDYRVSADTEGIKINFNGPDSSLMIGYHGDNLKSLSHILRIISKAKLKKDFVLKIDIADYLRKKESKVTAIVRKAIKDYSETGKPQEISGLDSYERRVVHLITAKEGFSSESSGEGENRKILIKALSD